MPVQTAVPEPVQQPISEPEPQPEPEPTIASPFITTAMLRQMKAEEKRWTIYSQQTQKRKSQRRFGGIRESQQWKQLLHRNQNQ